MQIKLKSYQDRFIFTEAKFPCLCAGIGTGKTFALLFKAWHHAETHPKSVNLIVRKEYTDLRDSTLKDFTRYFNVNIDSTKEYKFPNGSVLMFRHGSELNVLKNMSLSFVGIEQAEEFETDEQFVFLRDRLRHPVGKRQLCLICNASGHNYIWKLWKDAPPSKEYELITATSFENEDNLPEDFIKDLRRMEVEQPNHYQQYVMNSFDVMDDDDFVFSWGDLMECKAREYAPRTGYGYKCMGFDVARFGNDKCAAVGVVQLGALAWKVFHVEQWDKKDLDYTTGRILATANQHRVNDSVIDEDGMGAGCLDFLQVGRKRDDFRGFRNIPLSFEDDAYYANPRTANAFKLREYVSKGWISIDDELLLQELMTLRFRFTNDGRRILVSKDDMKKKGIKSPNMADALIMAMMLVGEAREADERRYVPAWMNSVAKEENLFHIVGVK